MPSAGECGVPYRAAPASVLQFLECLLIPKMKARLYIGIAANDMQQPTAKDPTQVGLSSPSLRLTLASTEANMPRTVSGNS